MIILNKFNWNSSLYEIPFFIELYKKTPLIRKYAWFDQNQPAQFKLFEFKRHKLLFPGRHFLQILPVTILAQPIGKTQQAGLVYETQVVGDLFYTGYL